MAHDMKLGRFGLPILAAVLIGTAQFAPARAADGKTDPGDMIGNSSGGGFVVGEEFSEPLGYEADLSAKTELIAAFDRYMAGEISLEEFRSIEAAAGDELGEPTRMEVEQFTPEARAKRLKGFARAQMLGEPCGPDTVPCDVVQMKLAVTHVAQSNNFYCGPASGTMVAKFLNAPTSRYNGVALTQVNMASSVHMRTHVDNATNWADNDWTFGINRWMRGTSTGTGYYVQIPSPSTSRFRQALRYDILDKHPFGISTVEWQGETSYNGHNTSTQTVGHWLTAFGFTESLDRTWFKDPASSVWAGTQPSIDRPTNTFVNAWLDTNGISA